MAEETDLAQEIAALCDWLNLDSADAGDKFLAERFEVQPWSAEFFEIVFIIIQRTHDLERLLRGADVFQSVVDGGANHLAQIRLAFAKQSLQARWTDAGKHYVGAAHSSPVRMLSGSIPKACRYPKLTSEETEELVGMVKKLLGWLQDHQLSEKDFIRESLIEGLERFLFRLERLRWFGWGYSVESLREVIGAYMALERGLDPIRNPDAKATLRMVRVVIQKAFSYGTKAKDATETGGWLLECYRAAVTYGPAAASFVAGYLTHRPG